MKQFDATSFGRSYEDTTMQILQTPHGFVPAGEVNTLQPPFGDCRWVPANVANNTPDHWNECWKNQIQAEWREKKLDPVYKRILELVPPGLKVVDFGGGVGILGQRLKEQKGCSVCIWEHNDTAIKAAIDRGLEAKKVHLEQWSNIDEAFKSIEEHLLVSTEVLEHLSWSTRRRIYRMANSQALGLIASVPHDRLGPEEESEHTIRWTALEFLNELRETFGEDARVEVLGPFMIGIAGQVAHKPYKLSVTFPARDEAADIGETLASFRGIADEIVVGIDPRTKDNTVEIVEKYAEKWFYLENPEGPSNDRVPSGGVHFAHIRNQCIDHCVGDWIFMTEAHESLAAGIDALLYLDKVMPKASRVGYVLRQGQGDQWAFPWLFRRHSDLRFKRSTHNILDMPTNELCVKMPQVITSHRRVHKRALERRDQRAKQNRYTLLRDWLVEENQTSLHYLGSETRDFNPEKAIERFLEFLAVNHNGIMRYHTRLLLAKEYAKLGRLEEAKVTLYGGSQEDWTRIEHWMWLGDIAIEEKNWEQAIQFFLYASTRIGNMPFTLWWIDLDSYTYLPAMKLAECYTELGEYDKALYWARRVEELLPAGASEKILSEIRGNIERLEKANGKSAESKQS